MRGKFGTSRFGIIGVICVIIVIWLVVYLTSGRKCLRTLLFGVFEGYYSYQGGGVGKYGRNLWVRGGMFSVPTW